MAISVFTPASTAIRSDMGVPAWAKEVIPKKRQKKSAMIFTDCMTRNIIVLLRGIAKRLAILEVVSYIKI